MHSHKFEDLVSEFENPKRNEWQKPEEVIAFVKNKFPKVNPNRLTVVDLGAGTGYFSFRFLEENFKVISLDINEKFLSYLKSKKESHPKKSNLVIQKTKENEIGLAKQTADILFNVNVYHHIENRVEYFKNARTVLKPNGIVVIIDFKEEDLPILGPPKHLRFPKSKIIQEMETAGYKVEVDESLLPYQNIYTLR
jgi:SAM-dependent methyltransferase